MKYLESAKTEYLRYKKLAEEAIQQVGDDALVASDGHVNSISIVVGHLAGNLKSRFTDFLTTDGEKPWREREREFEERGRSRDELLRDWAEGWSVLFEALEGLDEEDLSKEVTIRGVQLSVVEALNRSMAHVAYHVGQIVWLARAATGRDWRFLSIPPGKSAQYNANPTLEKGPNQ